MFEGLTRECCVMSDDVVDNQLATEVVHSNQAHPFLSDQSSFVSSASWLLVAAVLRLYVATEPLLHLINPKHCRTQVDLSSIVDSDYFILQARDQSVNFIGQRLNRVQ